MRSTGWLEALLVLTSMVAAHAGMVWVDDFEGGNLGWSAWASATIRAGSVSYPTADATGNSLEITDVDDGASWTIATYTDTDSASDPPLSAPDGLDWSAVDAWWIGFYLYANDSTPSTADQLLKIKIIEEDYDNVGWARVNDVFKLTTEIDIDGEGWR